MFKFFTKIKSPSSIKELERWMKSNCFNFRSYSINGNSISEGYGIDKIGGQFIWFYTERGEKRTLKSFETEIAIVKYAFNQLKADEWAKSHCIGFTESEMKHKQLKEKLEQLGINFTQDSIPYYSNSRPIFRTFVFGCDHRKVKKLKAKYFEKH